MAEANGMQVPPPPRVARILQEGNTASSRPSPRYHLGGPRVTLAPVLGPARRRRPAARPRRAVFQWSSNMCARSQSNCAIPCFQNNKSRRFLGCWLKSADQQILGGIQTFPPGPRWSRPPARGAPDPRRRGAAQWPACTKHTTSQ